MNYIVDGRKVTKEELKNILNGLLCTESQAEICELVDMDDENLYFETSIWGILRIRRQSKMTDFEIKGEALCKQCNYNPEKIGCELLRQLGYQVTVYHYSDTPPRVRDKNGKFLY